MGDGNQADLGEIFQWNVGGRKKCISYLLLHNSIATDLVTLNRHICYLNMCRPGDAHVFSGFIVLVSLTRLPAWYWLGPISHLKVQLRKDQFLSSCGC